MSLHHTLTEAIFLKIECENYKKVSRIKLAILASHNGSGFEALYSANNSGVLEIDISIVISNNSDSNALKNAKTYNIPTALINSKTTKNPDEAIFEAVSSLGCTHIFLSGYMKKISSRLCESFFVINSHPSLLPKHGGAGMYGRFVHEAVINSGDEMSGVTLHKVNTNYDEGEILLQKTLLLSENEDAASLEAKIKELEQHAIVELFAAISKHSVT